MKKKLLITAWLAAMLVLWLVFFLFERGNMIGGVFGNTWIYASAASALVLSVVPAAVCALRRVPANRTAACMLICCLLFGSCAAAMHFGTSAYLHSFTTEKWEKYPDQREYMIESLTTSRSLVGMNTDDLHSLLGEADKTEPRTDLYVISSDEDLYFAVQYNQGGIVTRTYTLRSGTGTGLSAY